MKKIRILKRIVTILLVIIMASSNMLSSISVYGAEYLTNGQQDDVSSKDNYSVNNDYSVSGNNGFGDLLSDAIKEESDDEERATGFKVLSVSVKDGVATANVDVIGNCTLIVGIYDNAGTTLVTSSSKKITKDDTNVTLQLEADKIPQYYYVKAYLVETVTYQPLCAKYENPDYTKEMEAFYATTPEDFREELVLNIGGGSSDNFAVYAEDTIIIPIKDNVNTFVSVEEDEDTKIKTYVFDHIDSTVEGLLVGDVVVYDDGNNLYIIKVGSITLEDGKATIVETETSLEEVFQYIRIEVDKEKESVDAEDEDADTGNESKASTESDLEVIIPDTPDDVGAIGASCSFPTLNATISFNEEVKKESDSGSISGTIGVTGGIEVNGTLEVHLDNKWEWFKTKRYYKVELKVDYEINVDIGITGTVEKEVKLIEGIYSIVPGLVNLTLGISIVFEATVDLKVSGTLSGSVGYRITKNWDSDNANKEDLSTKPEFITSMGIEGSLSIGLKFYAGLNIVCDWLANVEANITVSFNIEAGIKIDTDAHHACFSCVSGSINFAIKAGVTAELFGGKISAELNIELLNKKIKDFYYSKDNGNFGWGECPNYASLVDVYVEGDDKLLDGVWVEAYIYGDEEAIYPYKLCEDKVQFKCKKGNKYVFYVYEDGNYERCLKYDIVTVNDDDEKVIIDVTGALSRDEVRYHTANVYIKDGEEFLSGATVNVLGSEGIQKVYTDSQGKFVLNCAHNEKYKLIVYMDSEILGEYLVQIIEDEDKYFDISVPYIEPYSSFSYKILDDKTAKITRWRGNISKLEIPNNVNGHKIISIGDSAFEGSNTLTNVIIPSSITTIGDNAFKDCKGLTSIELPESVTSIGSKAFSGCTYLKNVKLSNNLTMLPEYVFNACTSLESIEVPESVTKIESRAFSSCAFLKSVKLPKMLSVLPEGVFNGCVSLTNVELPINLEEIPDYAFSGCSALETIVLPESITGIGHSAFSGCSALKKLELPMYIKDINSNAFKGCVLLESIELPESLMIIGSNAFNGCSGLQSIEFPKSIVSVGEYAFAGCTGLTSVEWPRELSSIGTGVFSKCTKLSELILADNLTSVGDYAFSGCNSLVSLQLPDSVTSIGNYAYNGCSGLQSIDFPKSIESVGEYAFAGCTGLTSVEWPRELSSIGMGVFSHCSNLNKVVIPDNLSSIGDYAFDYCTSLQSIEFPDGIKSIGYQAFYCCTGLQSIEMPDSLISIGEWAFTDCTSIKSVKLSKNLKEISYYSFKGCSSLQSIELPDGLTKIDNGGFYECKGLKTVTLPNTLLTINDYAFYQCDSLETVKLSESGEVIGDIVAGESLQSEDESECITVINDYAFYDCDNLQSVELPDGITVIGVNAFGYCANLKNIKFPKNLQDIKWYAFWECTSLQSIVFPENTATIDDQAFYKCTGLQSVEFPESLRTIGGQVFYKCTSLHTIKFSEGLEKIGHGAFVDCDSLENLELPKSLIEIDTGFAGCDRLVKVIAHCSESIIDDYVFANCYNLSTIEYVEGEIPNTDVVDTKEPEPAVSETDVIDGQQSDDAKEDEVLKLDDISTVAEDIALTTSEAESGDTGTTDDTSSVDSLIYSNTLSYDDLVAGQIYNFYIFKSETVKDVFATDNLLYVTQVTADETGSVSVSYTLDGIYNDVVIKLVGDEKADIADATINVKGWKYADIERPVYVELIYNNTKLIQGEDYELSSDVVVDDMGIYSVTITGIGAFTGICSANFVVAGDCVFGDLNGDSLVDVKDAVALKKYIAGMSDGMNTYAADANSDVVIDVKDAVKLMKFIAGMDVKLGVAE